MPCDLQGLSEPALECLIEGEGRHENLLRVITQEIWSIVSAELFGSPERQSTGNTCNNRNESVPNVTTAAVLEVFVLPQSCSWLLSQEFVRFLKGLFGWLEINISYEV